MWSAVVVIWMFLAYAISFCWSVEGWFLPLILVSILNLIGLVAIGFPVAKNKEKHEQEKIYNAMGIAFFPLLIVESLIGGWLLSKVWGLGGLALLVALCFDLKKWFEIKEQKAKQQQAEITRRKNEEEWKKLREKERMEQEARQRQNEIERQKREEELRKRKENERRMLLDKFNEWKRDGGDRVTFAKRSSAIEVGDFSDAY